MGETSLFGVKVDFNTIWEVFISNSFDVGVDSAVKHVDDTSGVRGKIGIVSDHNNSIAFGMNATELFHDEMGVTAVEITSWLVG